MPFNFDLNSKSKFLFVEIIAFTPPLLPRRTAISSAVCFGSSSEDARLNLPTIEEIEAELNELDDSQDIKQEQIDDN